MDERNRVVAPHQHKLAFGGTTGWQTLPSPHKTQCRDLIRQLLVTVVREEAAERSGDDERED